MSRNARSKGSNYQVCLSRSRSVWLRGWSSEQDRVWPRRCIFYVENRRPRGRGKHQSAAVRPPLGIIGRRDQQPVLVAPFELPRNLIEVLLVLAVHQDQSRRR